MTYKLICWNDYAMPVPVDAEWIAMDEDGFFYHYLDRPSPEPDGNWIQQVDGYFPEIVASVPLDPPEPGPWTEQLYWIGD